jgi:hypothetical protein
MCEDLTKIAQWDEDDESEMFTHVRSVTWLESEPEKVTRYKLNAHGSKRFMRGPVNWLFDLAGLDSTEPELQRYSRYFIEETGPYKVFHSLLPASEGRLDIQSCEEEIQKNMIFSLDHDLAAPSAEDIFAVRGILRRAMSDGLT